MRRKELFAKTQSSAFLVIYGHSVYINDHFWDIGLQIVKNKILPQFYTIWGIPEQIYLYQNGIIGLDSEYSASRFFVQSVLCGFLRSYSVFFINTMRKYGVILLSCCYWVITPARSDQYFWNFNYEMKYLPRIKSADTAQADRWFVTFLCTSLTWLLA
jgi:hypothetical protein